MLTAHHCATTTEVQTGGTATPAGEIFAWIPGGPYYEPGLTVYLHPTLDVALVELQGSVLDSTNTVRATPLFTGTSAGLLGQTVYCQGVGDTTDSAGFGTLTSAEMVVAQASVGYLLFYPNAQGQALYSGDSGAGCYLGAPGSSSNAVVSVHSQHAGEGGSPFGVAYDNEVGADGFEGWATSIIATVACSMGTRVPASCGTVSEFGGTYSCGTCASGETCSYDHCCPSGEDWSVEFDQCEPICTAKICPR
jgi:hypothetical protein